MKTKLGAMAAIPATKHVVSLAIAIFERHLDRRCAMTWLFLIALVAMGCGHDRRYQGHVELQRISCGTGFAAVGGCRNGLSQYLQRNPDVRIAAIDAMYDMQQELWVWTTQAVGWPRARDLFIAEIPCLPSAEVPDCVTTMNLLWAGPSRDHHAFIVPLMAEDRRHRFGGWSFLDVQSREPSTPAPARTVHVPCVSYPGQPFWKDFERKGIAHAVPSVRDNAYEKPFISFMCEQALLNFFRLNLDVRVQRIVAENGEGGTVSLLVLAGPPGDNTSPRARDLVVDPLPCSMNAEGSERCQVARNLPNRSRSLFSVPLGGTESTLPSPYIPILLFSAVQ